MKVTIVTKEYPPYVYGGAGVHVKFLARELAKLMDVEVRAFGDQDVDDGSLKVRGYKGWPRMKEGGDPRHTGALDTFATDLAVIRDIMDSNIVHTHTWYASLAGYMAKLLYNVPLVATVHSLEPLRPWKEEQLGRAYHLSTWAEKLALENADRVVAVSKHTRADILKHFDVKPENVPIIHNGIDLDLYRAVESRATLEEHGIEGPYILFVGRTSRQKGMEYLIEAMNYVDPGVTCVCCTSAPDTKELEEEIAAKVAAQPRVKWINRLLKEENYVELYTHANLFACPSVYEPFGIINLESMSCATPVVASAVGGILETIVDGETGILVPPADAKALANGINTLLRNPEMAKQYGANGRKRVEQHFSWTSIAKTTADMYAELIEAQKAK
ncbi:MAG: glycogen synthase [Myxococcota bacterium]|jgi:glycogen synthase|nr:glycogen synthase [Myxococcota bacterium]